MKKIKKLKIPILIIVLITLSLISSAKHIRLDILKSNIKQYFMSQDLGFSSYHLLTGNWNTNFLDIIRFGSLNFLDYLKYKSIGNNFKKLQININYENFSKLIKDRKRALDNKLLTNPSEVRGKIIAEGKTYRVKVRLKGDAKGHWESQYRMSLRVEVLDGLTILGNSKFSITKPAERSHPYDFVFQKTSSKIGNLSTNHQYANIFLNGTSWGVMDIEEHMSDTFLEKQKKKESIIIRFANEDSWLYQRQNKNFYKHYKLSDPNLFVKLYDKRKKLKNDLYRKKFSYIAEKHINKDIDLFDYDRSLSIFIISDLWNFHPLNASNVRYYFNPYSLKLEPIATDQSIFWWDEKNDSNQKAIHTNEMQHFFKILNKDGLEKNIIEQAKKIEKNLINIDMIFEENKKLFPLDNEIDLSNFKRYSDLILYKYMTNNYGFKPSKNKNEIEKPNKQHIDNLDKHLMVRHFDDGNLHIYNLLPDDVKIIKIIYEDKIIDTKQLIVPSYLSEKNPLKVNINVKGFQDNKITVVSDYKGKISKQSNYLSLFSKGLINPLQKKTDKLEFLEKINEKNYVIKKGKWFLNTPLVVNGNLEIREDTQIEFSENSYLIVKGRINFLGTKLNPIIFKAKSKTWKGLYVFNANQKSFIENCIFLDLDELSDGVLNLTGNINFYRSDVEINNLLISNVLAEDAINIVESNYVINNLEIVNARSDGIDSDFSNGEINNSVFKDIGGDAIDLSGSEVYLDNIKIFNVNDKGISVGENSNLVANNVTIKNSKIGIAIKDGSEAKIRKCLIKDSTLVDMSTFLKKDFYDFPKMIVENCQLKSKRNFLNQEGSYLLVDQKLIDSEIFNSNELYE